MRSLIGFLLLSMTLSVSAACPVQHPRVQPEIPDAAVASAQQMHRAQLEAERYLLQGQLYLDCGYMNRRQHNQLVSELERFAERYQSELMDYRSRSQMAVSERDRLVTSSAGLVVR
ncbi:MAG: hypothetical protein AAGF57_05215 [Pseudomonadota bacterium]